MSIPAEPICLDQDGTAPCPFWRSCTETRQRLQAGYERTEAGFLRQVRAPLRGGACWAYQQHEARLGSTAQREAQAERTAIREEGE